MKSETRPAERSEEPPRGPVAASLTASCPGCKLDVLVVVTQEEVSGSARVGPEADEAKPQAPGPQPPEPVAGQDPDQEAPRGPRERRCGERQGAPPRDGQRHRQGGEEGRASPQRRLAPQEPPGVARQRSGRSGLGPARRQACAIAPARATAALPPVFTLRSAIRSRSEEHTSELQPH